MSKREEILKKRLYGDALCAWVMAILIIICAVINLIVSSIAGFFDPQAAFQLTFGVSDFVYAVIGGIFGIISEIFYYGYELQEEMDSIV